MSRAFALGLALVCAGSAVLALSVYAMAQRVSTFYQAEPAARWHFEKTLRRFFTFHARPVEIADAATPAGSPALRVRFGPTERLIPVASPLLPNLADLDAYREFAAVLAFAPVERGEIRVNWDDARGARLVIVTRDTAGYDEKTWGAVRVKDWLFHLYELHENGEISARVVQFPDRRGRVPAEVYARDDLRAAGKDVPPMPEDGGPRLTSVELVQERSWEWQAALFAVPDAQVSRYRFKQDAVAGSEQNRGMGWTLPAAGFSAMGAMLGVIMIGGDRATRRRARSI